MSERPSEMPPFHERIEVVDQRDEPEKRPWENFKHLIRQLRKAAGSGFSRQGSRWHAGPQDSVPAPAPEPQTLRSPVRSVQPFTGESDNPPLPKPRALATESLRRVSGAARQAQWEQRHLQTQGILNRMIEAQGLQDWSQRLYGPAGGAEMPGFGTPRFSELSGYRQALYPTQPNLAGMVIEDSAWIRENLARAQRPTLRGERLGMQHVQQTALQEQQARNAQIQFVQAQRELAEAQARMLHEQELQSSTQPLKGLVTYEEIPPDPHEFFPASSYHNPRTREAVDLNQKLVDEDVLSDEEMKQLILDLDRLRYSAKTDFQRQAVEILEENTQTRLVENILARAPVTEEGLLEVYGLAFYPVEAELAATLDIEHFWEKESHISPKEIQRQLKDFAVELWDVAYGEDIRTVLAQDAHPLQRVWSGIQFLPVMKVTKLAKLGKLARFFQKTGHLGANPFKGKTPTQIHKMLTRKGYNLSEKAQTVGRTVFINPKSGRSYHIDSGINKQGKQIEHPHVDVNRRTIQWGSSKFPKRKYPL